jgi:desulfoferrodoxin (superoxide reductase-like protein)
VVSKDSRIVDREHQGDVMHRKLLAVASVAAAVLMNSAALANPPSAIYADYDTGRQELSVTVQHVVTKTDEHYIKEVAVTKNGEPVGTRIFANQTSHRNQTMTPWKFAANPGDTIGITATCNLFGSGSKTITVP